MGKLINIGIAGVAAWALFNLLRMKNVSDEIRTSVVNPRIHKIDISGLTLRCDAVISNPTRDSLSITKPVVTLTSNGKIITTSKPENQIIKIQPLTNSRIDSIEMSFGWTTLIPFISNIVSKIPALISAMNGNPKPFAILDIPLEMSMSTYADGIFIKSPVEKLN